MHTHMQCMQGKPHPLIRQTSLPYSLLNSANVPLLSTCVDYYVRAVNVSATLSGESNCDVLLTWEEPPGYGSIIGLWYRILLYSYSYSYRFSYRFSYSYATTDEQCISMERSCSVHLLLYLSESGLCPLSVHLLQQ